MPGLELVRVGQLLFCRNKYLQPTNSSTHSKSSNDQQCGETTMTVFVFYSSLNFRSKSMYLLRNVLLYMYRNSVDQNNRVLEPSWQY